MLERLYEIPWDQLSHAYGSAGDVPDMIRALASDDANTRANGLDGLYATICHQQCTVYEATAPAVPFLLELVGDERVKGRARILQLLGDILVTWGYLEAHGSFDSPEERAQPEYQQALAQEG